MRRKAYQELVALQRKIMAQHHAEMLLSWDSAVNPAVTTLTVHSRAYAMAEVQMLPFNSMVDSRTSALLDAARKPAEPGDPDCLLPDEAMNIREFLHRVEKAKKAASTAVERSAVGTARHNWPRLRSRNDWKLYSPLLAAVIEEKRELGQQLASAPKAIGAHSNELGIDGAAAITSTALTPFDALLDDFDHGLRSTVVDKAILHIRSWLPQLLKEVLHKQKVEGFQNVPKAVGPFRIPKQLTVAKEVLTALDFDFSRGRLDSASLTTETFPIAAGSDVRIAVQYDAGHYFRPLMALLGCAGDALYQQSLPIDGEAFRGQFLSAQRGTVLQRSQSDIFSDHIGRSRGFAKFVGPLLKTEFGSVPANVSLFSDSELYKRLTRVKPTILRTDADELTVPFHLMLRHELEHALISGNMEVDELPTAWDYRMLQDLGLETKGQFSQTVMAELQWPSGMIGYFGSTLAGALYAAQIMAAMRKQLGADHVDQCITQGVFTPLIAWLREKVWRRGSIPLTSEALLIEISGEPLNPDYYREHLTRRYLTDRSG